MPDEYQLPNEYQELVELLEELFEVRFCIYQQRETWQPCGITAETPQLAEQMAEFLNQHYSPFDSLIKSPEAKSSEASERLLALPIPAEANAANTGSEAIATALVVSCNLLTKTQYNRFISVTEKLLRQSVANSQTMGLCQELSDLMEETTWLRDISQHIRMCDASQDAKVLIDSLLPRLMDMVKAESVGFIANPEIPYQSSWLGKQHEFDIDAIIEKNSTNAMLRPVVVNNDQGNSNTPHSYVLVHVGMGGEHYGWIVACNRLDQEVLQEGVEFSTTGVCEFGTGEAGLMQAASALLSTHLRNTNLFEAKEQLLVGVIQAMSHAVDARDPYTKGHSDRVASYSCVIAEEMGFDEEALERIFLAGLLHDIGKIGIPDAVLNKTGKLTDEEYEIIKKHPQIGYNILANLPDISFVLPAVLHHHERADGKGYPHGLTAGENSSEANIMAVADAFDAMTSTRSYRPGMPLEKAKRIINEEIGAQFDPESAQAFMRAWPKIMKVSEAAPARCDTHREAAVALLETASAGIAPTTVINTGTNTSVPISPAN